MQEHEVSIIALSASESKKGFYVIILEEAVSKKRIPLVIGSSEAQSIAIFYENLTTQRPITHDLFKPLLEGLNATVKKALIYALKEDIFYAQLYVKTTDNKEFMLEARPSDALSIAIRFDAPIFVTDEILDIAGYEIGEKGREKKGSYAEYSLQELEDLLEKIIAKEDYESAASLRNAIERRKSHRNK